MLAWSLGKTVKDACLAELADFQADLTSNVNKDVPLGEQLHALKCPPSFTIVMPMYSMLVFGGAAIACEADANQLCNDVSDDLFEAAVSSCLW